MGIVEYSRTTEGQNHTHGLRSFNHFYCLFPMTLVTWILLTVASFWDLAVDAGGYLGYNGDAARPLYPAGTQLNAHSPLWECDES